jgi:hypothetical protein
MIVVKREPELRHIIAHLVCAIREVANGQRLSALDDLASIEGLVFFHTERKQEDFLRREVIRMKKKKKPRKPKPKCK